MPFQLPEDLTAVAPDELESLHAEGLAAARAISELSDEDLTEEQIAEAETIMAGLAQISAELDGRIAATEARNARLSALREALPQDGTEEDVPPTPEEDDDAEETDEPAPADKESVPMVASARRTPIANVARRAPAVIINDAQPTIPTGTLVAAANVPGYGTGEELVSLDTLADAFIARARGFGGNSNPKGTKKLGIKPGRYGISQNAQRFGVARVRKPESEFVTGADDSLETQFSTIMNAAKEKRLPGGSLVAAGGWCAPSETLWDFCSLETTEGLLSIPEVTARRGGIQFTRGPQLSDFIGFHQTEAEAEAGTEKVCWVVDCPDWEEVRLEAIGFCVSNGLLANAAYPELTRRTLELAVIGQARAINAATIDAISDAAGTAIDFTEVGSATADLLDALTLQAVRLRQSFAMSPNATIEVILPHWTKDIVKSDLSRRTGVDLISVSDQQVSSYFGNRGLSVQYVYDYQMLAGTGTGGANNTSSWTSWPDTIEAILYPAGTFVRLTNDVIDLDTIYDSVGLSTNTYTAAFFEEGFAVANTCGQAVKVSIDIACLAGVTGAAELTCIAPAG